jgi:hypothetical protein
MPESGRPAQGGGPVDGKATFQAESLTAPELSERPATCGEAANRFLREQPENHFHVADDRHQAVPIGKTLRRYGGSNWPAPFSRGRLYSRKPELEPKLSSQRQFATNRRTIKLYRDWEY